MHACLSQNVTTGNAGLGPLGSSTNGRGSHVHERAWAGVPERPPPNTLTSLCPYSAIICATDPKLIKTHRKLIGNSSGEGGWF